MSIDPTAQNVGVGGMLFLSSLYMILKFKPWKSNGHHNDATDVRLDALEKEVKGLREWRHGVLNSAQEIIARDFLDKRK